MNNQQINEYIVRRHDELPENRWCKAIAEELNKQGIKITRNGVRCRYDRYMEALESKQEETQKPIEDRLLDLLKKSRIQHSVYEVADTLNVSPKAIREAAKQLQDSHYMAKLSDHTVQLLEEPQTGSRSLIDVESFYGNEIVFGAIGDTHLCSKYERLDVLNTLYDVFEREGVTTVYHTGNHIDGEAKFNKNDIHTHGMGNQIKYFVENFPQRNGITTNFITGDDHEGWYTQREGVDTGQMTEDSARRAGRTDLVHLGYMEHDVVLQAKNGSSILRLVHAGGGSSYAISYTTQKLIESYSGGEKPAILLIGHYHKAEYQPAYRNVHAIQTGCTLDQTPFMRKKRLSAHVGGWIIRANQAPDGHINRFRAEWISFFNREFYEKKWTHQMMG